MLAPLADEPNAQIARTLGVSTDTVRTWRRRFATQGPAGLSDRPRPGRPPVYDLDVHLAIMATPHQRTRHRVPWSHRSLAQHLGARGVGISASQIGRILTELERSRHSFGDHGRDPAA
ncbi:MAG TPA: helix-turn-helix domain-containing protein [Pseudonocardiaceae bacterium]|nr:helix-turn-helix domain-containing protein [Pseudonocardiaceae bacterium]